MERLSPPMPSSSTMGEVWTDPVSHTRRGPVASLPAPARSSKPPPPYSVAMALRGDRAQYATGTPTGSKGEQPTAAAAPPPTVRRAVGSSSSSSSISSMNGSNSSGSSSSSNNSISNSNGPGSNRLRRGPSHYAQQYERATRASSTSPPPPPLPPRTTPVTVPYGRRRSPTWGPESLRLRPPTVQQHSSSGSEDEGFGGDYECTLRRLHALTSAPLGLRVVKGKGLPAPSASLTSPTAADAPPATPARPRMTPSCVPPPLPPRRVDRLQSQPQLLKPELLEPQLLEPRPAVRAVPALPARPTERAPLARKKSPGAKTTYVATGLEERWGWGEAEAGLVPGGNPPPLPVRPVRLARRPATAMADSGSSPNSGSGSGSGVGVGAGAGKGGRGGGRGGGAGPGFAMTRSQSLPVPNPTRAAKVLKKRRDEEERRTYFRDPRLEETLALIRSGQAYCEERHIVVDFVRRAQPCGIGAETGRVDVQAMEDLLRHALLLTNAALYLLEVEMQPPHVQQHQQQHQQQQQQPKDPGNAGDETKALTSRRSLQDRANAQTTDSGAALPPFMEAVSESREFREEGTLELAGTGRGVPAGAAGGGGGGGGGMEKAKIKSIKMMDRLQPSQLLHVSLPFKEVTLRNGDVVARRGCGVVLHTKVSGRSGHVWLKCRTNQDRGALVDALVSWFEANSLTGAELNVQQVPESPLATQLAQFNAAAAGEGGSDTARRKDTDCVIS